MQAGQPVALAFVSIGASYYVDSNGSPAATPSADAALSNVLKTAYTTLFGAGNFRIIRSDTFDPYLTVGKGITALKQLEGWLGAAQVFYLFGHGAGPQGLTSPSISARSTTFGSIDDTGYHMDFFPSTNVSFDKNNGGYIFVPTYVQGHNYVFAWIDSCNSAGGDSVTGVVGTVDHDSWSKAFNATTFIGNNGFDIVNNNGPTGLSYWYKWRNTFWNNLATGQTVNYCYLDCWAVDGVGPGGTHLPFGTVDTTTYPSYYLYKSATYNCTPGDGYGSNPRVVLYGDPYDTTLVPQ